MGVVFSSLVAYVVVCRGLYQAVGRHSPTERQDNYTSFGLQYQHPGLSGHDTIRVGTKTKALGLLLVSLQMIPVEVQAVLDLRDAADQ